MYEENIELERKIHLKNIELGEALSKLKANPDYIKISNYLFDELLPSVSSRWAISEDKELQGRMRALLLFKSELDLIEAIAIQSKHDLKSLIDFESTEMED